MQISHRHSRLYGSSEQQHNVVYTAEVVLAESEFLPIKTFQSFEVDPLAGITGTLAKLEDTDDEIWIQILVRPVADDWHKASGCVGQARARRWVLWRSISTPKARWFSQFLMALWQPPEGNMTTVTELSDRDKTRIAEAEKKAAKLGYQVKIRVAYLGDSTTDARLRMQAIIGTFKQYNSTNLNGFTMTSR